MNMQRTFDLRIASPVSLLAHLIRQARAILASALVMIGLAGAAQAQVAGTVEQGLDELARAIAQKSREADRTTIAVLPFPNADGSCSVLSTYVVDELILALFSLPDAQIEIIERAQLEALIRELQIGAGGLLNPATTKQLGNLSGVNALTIGTITVIGDLVRLNARLVATDTGRTLSAAAVTVPKTGALDTLLRQPAACSTVETKSASAGGGGSTPAAGLPRQEKAGLRVEVVNVKGDSGTIDVVIRVTNVSTDALQIAHHTSSHQFDNGTICDTGSFRTAIRGISDNTDEMTDIAAGEAVQYSITRINCDSKNRAATLASRLVLDVRGGDGDPKEVAFQLFDVPYTKGQ